VPNVGGPKASRAGSNSQFVPATIPEEDSGRDGGDDRDFHFGKSRDSSAMFQQDLMVSKMTSHKSIFKELPISIIHNVGVVHKLPQAVVDNF
jgi:hypothetical protein